MLGIPKVDATQIVTLRSRSCIFCHCQQSDKFGMQTYSENICKLEKAPTISVKLARCKMY